EQRVLGLRVQGRGRLVEGQQQRLVAHETAGQRQLLPLPEGHLDTARPGRAELGVETGRQLVHDVGRAGPVDRGAHRRYLVDARYVADADRLPGQQLEPAEL